MKLRSIIESYEGLEDDNTEVYENLPYCEICDGQIYPEESLDDLVTCKCGYHFHKYCLDDERDLYPFVPIPNNENVISKCKYCAPEARNRDISIDTTIPDDSGM